MTELLHNFCVIIAGIVNINYPTAAGIVSIGGYAFGIIAVGVNAFGIIAIGGINSIGVISIGGINAIGILSFAGGNSIAFAGSCLRKNGFKGLKKLT